MPVSKNIISRFSSLLCQPLAFFGMGTLVILGLLCLLAWSYQHQSRYTHPVKIAIISDIHKCSADTINSYDEDLVRQFVEEVDRRGTDFNMDLGDNASRRTGKCSKNADQDFIDVIRLLKTKAPLYHVLGDHDIEDADSLEAWKRITGMPRTYYSFDLRDVHVVVLDNITGDGTIHKKCTEDSLCKKLTKAYEELLVEDSQERLLTTQQAKQALEERRQVIENSRNKKIRNHGSISSAQLSWLSSDLKHTSRNKVVIFSELPIFYHTRSDGKVFDIKNRETLQAILRSSGKKIVSISGDAHEWGEFQETNIHYYVLGSFTVSQGEWAYLEWGKDDFVFKREKSSLPDQEKPGPAQLVVPTDNYSD